MIPPKIVIEEHAKLKSVRDELARTLAAFDTVVNYFNAQGMQLAVAPPSPPVVDTSAKLIAAPAPTTTGGFWDRVITEAIEAGAHTSGEIWRAIQKKHGLGEEKHPPFYQSLAAARNCGLLARKSGKYYLPPKPKPKARRSVEPVTTGYWDGLIIEALGSGGKLPTGEIWKIIQRKHRLPENRRAAFYQGVLQTLKRGLISRLGNDYYLPAKPAPKRSHHAKTKTDKFPWTSAIVEAVALGATTSQAIWESIQKKHNLPQAKRQTISVALPYARRKGYVIRHGCPRACLT